MNKFKGIDTAKKRITNFRFRICNVGETGNGFRWIKKG
jgi:hypothetical protein